MVLKKRYYIMKNIIKILTLLFFTVGATKVHAQSCCEMANSGEAFQAFASNESFRKLHASPLPLTLVEETGKNIKIKTKGADANGYLIAAKSPSKQYLFVYQEWWGLNNYIKQEAMRLAAEFPNVNVLAVDLYDGKIATDPETAGKYMQSAKPERLQEIVNGAIAYTPSDAKIISIGWCFGGGWSLQSAILSGKKSVGCVIYYGMPEKDINKLKTLNGDVLGIFASKEKWINTDVVTEFENNMKAANKKLVVHNFDAEHAFANPSNPNFDAENTEKANEIVIKYLSEKFN